MQGRPGSSCNVPPAPQGVRKLELDVLRRRRVGGRHLRACPPLFVLAEGFTGLFEADPISANLEESGHGSQRPELKGPPMGNKR